MAMLSGVGLPGGGGGKLFTGTWQQNYSFLLKCFTQARVGAGGLWSVVWSPFDLIFALWWSSHGRSNYCLCFQEKYYEFIVLKLTSSCLMHREQKRRNYANNSVL